MFDWDQMLAYYMTTGLSEKFIRHVCISKSDAEFLVERVAKLQPTKALEIGSFIGLSTGVIAMASLPTCELVCVDLNLPVKAHPLVGSGEVCSDDSRLTLEHVKYMLERFQLGNPATLIAGFFSRHLNKEIMARLTKEYPEVERLKIIGNEISQYGPFDLIFIDGDHSEEGVNSDLEIVHSHLSSGGEILLHDVSGDWGLGVNAGMENFLAKHTSFELIEARSDIACIIRKEK